MRQQSIARHESAFALVLTLALVVLITFAVVAYFSRATTNRRIESATSAAVNADTLAHAAGQIIISDIRGEITAGSNINQPSQQMAIFTPIDAQKMVPSRTDLQAALQSDPAFNNLVKQSGNRFYPSSGGYNGTPLILTSTGQNTAIMSANKRNVSTVRWNAPFLNSGIGFSSDDQLPRWILIDRRGVAVSQTWDNTFRDYTPGNDSAIIGRFAFNVYDVGGLLDVNVAGNPVFSTQLTDAQIQQLKSTEAGASLYNRINSNAILPDFDATRQTALVNTWRYKSNSSSNFFTDFMSTSPTFADSGFMRPTVRSSNSNSNSVAFSRQDLLRLTEASAGYLTTAALPYFTHFSRELNAPTWIPVTPSGSTIDYGGQAEQSAATNRDILNVRVKSTFTRADGTTAVVGEPLIKYRFPLRRLDAISYNGINPAAFLVMAAGTLQSPNATTVQRDFGLIFNSANNRWDYVGATGNSIQNAIATLDQVATANREPNFFEMLKAFILSGSIGLGSNARTFVNAETRYYQPPQSSDAEIIEIGANIIDQWDADKNPTVVFFGTDEFAGVENLPYLNKIGFQPCWTSAIAFSAWLVPSFWTPAQNGAAVGPQSATVPIVRFVMSSGSASAVVEGGAAVATSNTVTGSPTQPLANLTTSFNFNMSDGASSGTSIKVGMTGTPDSKLGIPLTFSSLGAVNKANTTRAYPKIDNATFEMQAQIGGLSGPWKTYQRWVGCTANISSTTATCDTSASFDWGSTTIFDPEFVLLDPRVMRFGAWETHASATSDTSDYTRGVKETLDRATGGLQKITGMGPQGPSFTGVGAEMANNTSGSPKYVDLDGIQRGGDLLTPSATSAMLPTNSADRPPILNSLGRQLRMVGELGTVSRGQPWKTLNFTTSGSGDAALLDAFTVFEPNTVFRSDLTAGKVSLNTRQAPVLRAVLQGIATNTNASTPLISESQRDTIVDALITMTATQPFVNKAELVTRLAADPSVTILGNKEAREAVIRAFSDVGQTRTWNLLIDVIAQCGRFGGQASTVDDFVTEGEKRYWLHLAIDRFTGEVIDEQLEKINE